MSLRPYLRILMEERRSLNRLEAAGLLQIVLDGHIADSQQGVLELSALVGALGARGETAPELAGFVDAMRAVAVPVPVTQLERSRLVDSCGTGGDGSGTFNISTAAALVAAAAGATVAKHGNRAVTSSSGSADVLEMLGIPVGLLPDQAAVALRSSRFAFLHAPSLHPAMKAFMPIRRALGVRTIFNLVGPLSNPAGAPAQVIGVYARPLVPVVAEALAQLGTRHAMVVHGLALDAAGNEANAPVTGLDEISTSGPTDVAEVRNGIVTLRQVTPEQFGLTLVPLSALAGGDAAANAAILKAVFAGQQGPQREIVGINAAAVLVVAGLAEDLESGLKLAFATIDSGAVVGLVQTLTGIPPERLSSLQEP